MLAPPRVYTDPYTFDDSPVSTPDDYLAYVVGVDRSFYGVFSELDELDDFELCVHPRAVLVTSLSGSGRRTLR